jgi:simple sugar transport system permease protein
MNNTIEFVQGLLISAAPLMLGSLGALLTELAGSLGIFIEGFMTMGAFFSWVISGATGSAAIGIMASGFAAALLGAALCRFVHIAHADPFIAALALNIAAAGLCDSLSIIWFGTKGVLRNPVSPGQDAFDLPPSFFGLPISVYLAWVFTLLAALVISRTRIGLRLRASGLSAAAASERGIRPESYREWCWALAAFLAVLGGAALTFRVGAYTPGGVAGRGWICLAAVFLGFRHVWGVAAAAIVFALAERFGIGLQIFGALPATVLLGLPSALALLLYAVSSAIRSARGKN